MKTFYAMVDELAALPDGERGALEQRIREAYEVERTVFVLDMSGFSLSVRRSGILAHLCQIRRVQRLAAPLVEAHGGEVLKCEADNVLADFAAPAEAVAAAIAVNRALAAQEAKRPGAVPLTVGIGIDHGRFLLIPGKDAFGDPVNIAHKLGEDIARPGEILVTAAVRDRLGGPQGQAAERLDLSIAGVELEAWRIGYEAAAGG